jgi:anti-sigma factor RsiW
MGKMHGAWLRRWAAAAVLGITGFVAFKYRSAKEETFAREIVASHIRSLIPGHVADFVNNDEEAVRAWFAGRVDLAPVVAPLASAGFSLVGGRLDYLEGRRVPVVVYSTGAHILNVYSWRTGAGGATLPEGDDAHGYHLLHWQRLGVWTCVVTDLDALALRSFAELLRSTDESATPVRH